MRQMRAFAERVTMDTYASFLDHADAILGAASRQARSPTLDLHRQ
jgi:hypothetical protein